YNAIPVQLSSPPRHTSDLARMPVAAKRVRGAHEVPLLVATCVEADPERCAALERAGAKFLATETYDGRIALPELLEDLAAQGMSDRKSTRLNSSLVKSSYA